MAHGATEATEITQCHGGADGTKTDGGVAYSFFDNFRCKYFEQKVSNRTWQTISVAQCTNGASVTSIALF